MKKIKYPNLIENIIKPDQIIFNFDGGDLWKRKNVDKWDDIDVCIEIIEPHLKKHKTKIKKFGWHIDYSIPMDHQREQMKHYIEYKIKKYNTHFLEPLFSGADNILYVGEDLLTANEDFVSLVANKIEGLKKLYFWMTRLSGGFLEAEDYHNQMLYIKGELKNELWQDSMMEIIEAYQPEFIDRDDVPDDKHGNDLDALIFLRKSIDPNIKFEFDIIDDDEKEILKKNSII